MLYFVFCYIFDEDAEKEFQILGSIPYFPFLPVKFTVHTIYYLL